MNYYKEQTKNLPITKISAPEFVYIPLLQHAGAPAKPLVKVGDKVFLGQLLGSTDAFVTANVHSSVSGEVVEFIKIQNPLGQIVDVIKIKNDQKDTVDPALKPKRELKDLSIEEIREIVRESGLVGMGGAAFPTHVKLSPPAEKNVDTVILNAAECEPFLTSDHRLLLEKTADILYGLQAAAKAVEAEKIFIGIEDNKMDAVEALKKAGAQDIANIKVLKTEYPAGAEKVLVKKILRRTVPNKGIPLDVGVVVINVGTAYQLAQTLKTGLPCTERVVTVSGLFTNPGNYLVKVGTLLKDFVKLPMNFADADIDKNYKIVAGGPMMGYSIDNLDMPVTKGLSGIVLIDAKEFTESNCIRCGKCVDVCPLGLRPYQDQGSDECMECGRCAYECPAHRFLVQRAKLVKQKVRAAAK